MTNNLKQCILIFKLSTLFLISGCMAPVYELTSNLVDSYFERRQIKRICTSLYLEIYRANKDLTELGTKIKIKSINDDLKAQQTANELINKIINKTDTIEDLDLLGKVLDDFGPNSFKICTKSTLKYCDDVTQNNKNSCHEKYTQLNFLQYYKSSDFFNYIKSAQKEEIITKIEELKSR